MSYIDKSKHRIMKLIFIHCDLCLLLEKNDSGDSFLIYFISI